MNPSQNADDDAQASAPSVTEGSGDVPGAPVLGAAQGSGQSGSTASQSSSVAPNDAGAAGTSGRGRRGARTKASSGDRAVGHLRIQPRGDSAPAPAKKGHWWELPVLIIVAVAVAVIVKTFLVQPFYIPSGSMEKTLHGCPSCNGDKILVNKPIFDLRAPHPGDIIVFSLPDAWPKVAGESPVAPKTNIVTGAVRWFGQLVGVIPPDREDLVKRVIAVGGQTVKCCDAQGRVQVSTNGPAGPFRSLDEPYTYLHDPDGPEMPFPAVTVPHGRLWVMGDHRTDSADSRFHCVAGQDSATASGNQPCDPVASTVPISGVIGKAFVIAWPPSRWRTLGTPHTFRAGASAAAASLTSGLPLTAAGFAVVPLWFWRRRTRW